MRQPLVAGNWKMHGSRATARALSQAIVRGAGDLDAVEAVVLPPFLLIPLVAEELADSAIVVGAQNVAAEPEGPYTGEVSAAMLKEFGCRYVVVGHSERRQLFGDTDSTVGKRALAALRGDLRPIICLGESLADRDAGRTESVVGAQFEAAVAPLPRDSLSQIVLAYEPVWAIGTGRTAAPEQAQAVHAMLRDELRRLHRAAAEQIRIIYGGSMKPENAQQLLVMPDIDGGLVGGASLQADSFLAICQAAADPRTLPNRERR